MHLNDTGTWPWLYSLSRLLSQLRELFGDLAPAAFEAHRLVLLGISSPSGPRMIIAERPPARQSCSISSTIQGLGHHHSA
ncbi:MAG: hypothetical protein V4475_12230 [Pseudomonadota bacterium]